MQTTPDGGRPGSFQLTSGLLRAANGYLLPSCCLPRKGPVRAGRHRALKVRWRLETPVPPVGKLGPFGTARGATGPLMPRLVIGRSQAKTLLSTLGAQHCRLDSTYRGPGRWIGLDIAGGSMRWAHGMGREKLLGEF